MTEPTELPVDVLARLRVEGRRRGEASPLAAERVRAVQVNGTSVYVLFAVTRDGHDRGMRQVVLERVVGDGPERYEVTNAFDLPAPTPAASRTGGATAGMELRPPLYGPPRPMNKVLPPKTIREDRPMPPADFSRGAAVPCRRAAKLPLEPGTLASVIRATDPERHAWLYGRLVADHGKTIAAPAWVEAHARFMRRPVSRRAS